TAASMSARSADATSATTSSVAGLTTSSVFFDAASRHWLSMKSCLRMVPWLGSRDRALANRDSLLGARFLDLTVLACGFPGLELEHMSTAPAQLAHLRGRAGQRGKRPEVHRHDLLDAEELAGLRGLRGTHRVQVADGQERDVRLVHLADEPHVAEHRRVAGEI